MGRSKVNNITKLLSTHQEFGARSGVWAQYGTDTNKPLYASSGLLVSVPTHIE